VRPLLILYFPHIVLTPHPDHPRCVLDAPIDFACVETQMGTKSQGLDCELVRYGGEGQEPVGAVIDIPLL
jgi:allantoicase